MIERTLLAPGHEISRLIRGARRAHAPVRMR